MSDVQPGATREVVEAVAGALPVLELRAVEVGWKALRERDLQKAMEQSAGAKQRAIELKHWPDVGAIDLLLEDRVALELKWAQSGDTLCNCAWDIGKLATAIAERRVDVGFLVAGAPETHWQSAAAGTELLAAAEYPELAIVDRYESWWRFWCRDVRTQPLGLPAGIATTEISETRIALDGEPFVVRVTEVRVRNDEWTDFVCPHVARGEKCRAR